jgi:hypothetical protein
MVAAWAFLATAIATLFAQATAVRYTRYRKPHELAWTVALACYALGSAFLAAGAATGWDSGTFRAFYLFGAILTVPWLALGTIALLTPGAARIGRAVLVFASGLATGMMLAAPMSGVIDPVGGIPNGKDLFGAGPRVLAGVGSGLGALVVFGGAAWSVVRLLKARAAADTSRADATRAGRLATTNALVALGVVIASSGGLLQGVVGGGDQAFAMTTAIAIAVIYAGFLVSEPRGEASSARRMSLPPKLRGSSETTSTRVGSL